MSNLENQFENQFEEKETVAMAAKNEAIVQENEEGKLQEEIQVKPYTLRRISAEDVFTMSSIIGKIGVDEVLEALDVASLNKKSDMTPEEKEKELMQVGIQRAGKLAQVVLKNINKCKEQVFSFISNVSGMTDTEVRELEPAVFLEMLVDLFKKEEFANFMKVVFKLLK
ncbi:MAG: hypothetical protein ACRCUS_06890 [Anaerovoracaceae bacterium]